MDTMRLSSYSRPAGPAEAPSGLTGNPARDLANSFNLRVILFLSLHAPLALAMNVSPWFSTIHGALALLYGLRAALLGRTSQVIYAAVYIAAAEVLWRMSRAHLLWEYAKYAIVLILFVALIAEWGRREGAMRLRSAWPALLLVALVPAAVIVILQFGPAEALDPISFNLSGYLALAALGFYLWARPIDREKTVRLLLAGMAPVVSITFLAVYFTLTDLDSLIFLGDANWITSGNYGPNQVSTMMGFGALAGVMLLILIPRALGARAFILLMSLAMLGQGVLTFSRGGIYSFALGLAVFGFHVMQTPRARRRFVLLFILFGGLFLAGIYPFLDDFTGGSLSQRFADTNTTGRLEAALVDLQAFSENPVVGIGVGQSAAYHKHYLGYYVATHTEFTRLLAEHGLFGLVATGILIVMLARGYLRNQSGVSRGMSAALAVWAASVMLHVAMRLAVIPLALGLSLALWQLQPPAGKPQAQPDRPAGNGEA
jgi:hypothetical protein